MFNYEQKKETVHTFIPQAGKDWHFPFQDLNKTGPEGQMQLDRRKGNNSDLDIRRQMWGL